MKPCHWLVGLPAFLEFPGTLSKAGPFAGPLAEPSRFQRLPKILLQVVVILKTH